MKQKNASIKDLDFKFTFNGKDLIIEFIGDSVIGDELNGKTLREVCDKVIFMTRAIHDKYYIPKNPDGSYTWNKELEDKLTDREIEYIRLSFLLASLARDNL